MPELNESPIAETEKSSELWNAVVLKFEDINESSPKEVAKATPEYREI